MTQVFNADDYAYVVGIDFGTTFSGCCYAYTKDTFEDFQDITTWPKQRNVAYPKTPTVILYKKDSQQVGAWGDAARQQSERPNLQDHFLEKFKLYLDEATSATLSLLPNGLTPLQVIADYLRSLHDYIHDTMKRGFAQNYDQRQYRYCLTVPATWSDQAKAVMREAAIMAGMIDRNDPLERLSLISEPEAAALYCQKTCDQFNLVHGQRFMICDAGGGTVDLIVFEINDNAQDRSLKEVTKGSGDTCGSTFLDQNMEQLIREKFEHFGPVNQRAMDQMMSVFVERIKPQFDDDGEDHFIPIPFTMGYPNNDNMEVGIMDGTLIFTTDELKEKVFDPVVEKVIRLIRNQLDGSALKPVDAIFMVGGFGKSNYLHRRVNETFIPRVKFVGIPPRAEMAVVRGAVYFGLNPRLVAQRVSRRTYGLNSQIPFEERLDPIANRVNVHGRYYCKQRFSVYAHKGQPIGLDECVTKKYLVTYPHGTETDLYAFDGEGVPPRLVTDPRVNLVARFPIKMPTFEGVRVGEQLTMTVNMYFGQTEIKIEVLILDRRCVFTSRLDLLTADSYNNQSVNNKFATPTQPPPPYTSPAMSTASASLPTSSTPSTPLSSSTTAALGKPDEAISRDAEKPHDPELVHVAKLNKPHTSDQGSSMVSSSSSSSAVYNNDKHQTISSSSHRMVLTSHHSSNQSSSKMLPPPPPIVLSSSSSSSLKINSSTKELVKSTEITNRIDEKAVLDENELNSALLIQKDEKTLTPDLDIPTTTESGISLASTSLPGPTGPPSMTTPKKKSMFGFKNKSKLLVKLKLA
ncbi:uncharacterized protein BX664DRAFT_341244 [Halteromyces radiatus]|uniref:uncharacterized protein n=1 Tax=Halteromyces radiatus TaxID=101107 RepID=UPI00222115FA|nr:uncharacterized protein BX664DRAFT_341244 [Halteromyces radiatus]KAI8081766.1 hypothetical protein BX664DRAFT_341244 [Halteromyces radiatus]